jgi:hypothetical protein
MAMPGSPVRATTAAAPVATLGRAMSTNTINAKPWRLGARARRTVLTFHIVSGVGLLGATSATLLLAIQAAATGDAAFADSIYRLMSVNSAVFGIPLSFLSLFSGILLGLGTGWGVLRHWWTTLKLILILGVILNGSLLIGPTVDDLRGDPMVAGTQTRAVFAAALSAAMLLTATALSVFKPGGRLRRRRS